MNRNQSKTWVEIDRAALAKNLRCIGKAIGPSRSIILVVKSDSYGHGARGVVDVAAGEGITRFAVATVDEGAMLRRFDTKSEILLLHPPLAHEWERAIEWNLTPTIADLSGAEEFSRLLKTETRDVHIEINTGMNRLGLDWQDAADTIAQIVEYPNLRIGGVFTHFRTAEPTDADAVREQMERFESVQAALRIKGVDPGLCHAASSYVLAYHADTLCDAVRPGLLAYGGITVDPKSAAHPALTGIAPVMSVRTRVLRVRNVAAGEWVHYGAGFHTERAMRVAVLPIGYGMGYSRHLTNCSSVLIQGKRAPVIGTIGMDMTTVDLDGIGNVLTGDLVTVMGRDGDETITAEDLARWSGTIPYEITCRLGNALPRCEVNAGTDARTPKAATTPAVR